MARATLVHQLHDLGAAAWFGGTRANAVALNPAASSVTGLDASSGTSATFGVVWDTSADVAIAS